MEEDASTIVRTEEDAPKAISGDELIEQSDLTADDIDRSEEVAREGLKGRPAVTLTEYQRDIVTRVARFLAFMVCRQGGKTFASTLRIARKLLDIRIPFYILSRSERQSGNAIAQTAVHLRAVEKALKAKGKRLAINADYSSQKFRVTRADGSEAEYRRLKIKLPNGSVCIGLPATPDTCVGISGSMYCDEFAVQKDSRLIWSRLFPVVSRRAEYEFLITSTPRGIGNKFYEIMTSQDYEGIFARIIVDIFTAVKQGLTLRDYEGNPIVDEAGIERLRLTLRDADAWDEDYLCKFIDDVLNLLTYELIGKCERLHNDDGKPYEILTMPPDYYPGTADLGKLVQPFLKGGHDLYLGFDQARTKNLSVIWLDEDIDGTLWQRAMICMQNKDYEFQEAALWQFMSLPKLRRGGIDATGLGGRTAERTHTRFGERAVPINFGSSIKDKKGESHPAKSLLARVILERHQDGRDRYPVLDQIRDDFHRVKRKRGTSPDTFTYFADNDESGHADIFTAKALSDLVAQEMREYSGKVDGMRVETTESTEKVDVRSRESVLAQDTAPERDEWVGIGSTL